MAEITTGTITPLPGARLEAVTGGETVANNDLVYRKAADLEYYQASNDVDAESAAVRGIVINGGNDGDPIVICTGGPCSVSTPVTAGKAYAVSNTPGNLMDAGDLTSGEYISGCGYSISTSVINFRFTPEGVAVP